MTRWLGVPGLGMSSSNDATEVSFGAAELTDWFRDPRTGSVVANAPVLIVTDGPAPVTVACVAEPVLGATFDAAALFVHFDDEHWVKLAVERSPVGEATVVSVRTEGRSDDCNHHTLPGPACELRVSIDESSIALHARTDGAADWQLVRYCPRPTTGQPTVGLLVQSPTGPGTTARFRDVRVEPHAVGELRDGS